MFCGLTTCDFAKVIQCAKRFLKRKKVPYYPPEYYSIPDSTNCQRALEIVAHYSPNFLTQNSL
jgi:hypothetical protein